ncbi:MAG: glycosyltransferase [Hyphomicrobiales bacterium]|nr:glycosyltransferase [Hyphomicrobiales bacterium]
MAGNPYELFRNPDSDNNARSLPERRPARSYRPPGLLAHTLPLELAFLTGSVSPENLLSSIQSGPEGVLPLDVILGEGIIGEEAYYRALARHLGCRYYSGDPPFALEFDAARALQCGVAPLAWHGDGPRAVIAPRAQSVALLMEATQSGRVRSGSFAVASPQRFASLVRARCGEATLQAALGRLPARLSARYGLTSLQAAVAAAVATSACILGYERLDILQLVASGGLWLAFSAALLLRSMAATASSAEDEPPLLTDDELPVYTVVAALYREANVVEALVRAFDAFDYPKSKLDIKLVVEQRDMATLSRIVELRLPARYEVIVAPPGRPATKPRALNIGLASARGELLVVYDAEDAPAPNQLRLAASRFAADKDVDCLQARLTIRNPEDSWLSKLFSVEYAALFDLINPGLCALELPIALGGTSNHFRASALGRAGAWDEWNVTEDADLGIRLARLGYRVAALNSDTWEEAPHELGNWFRQRVRWQKGWMQTLIVHTRRPIAFARDLGPLGVAAAITLLLGSILGGLFWPFFAAGTIWRALTAAQGPSLPWREATDVFVYFLALSGVWAIVVPALVAGKLRSLNLSAKTVLLLPVYYILVSAASWTALLHLVLWPHHWAKTAHGRIRARPVLPVLSAQSRG